MPRKNLFWCPKLQIKIKHTVRKSSIVSKNSIFRKLSKLVYLNFRAKNSELSKIFDFSLKKLFHNFDFFFLSEK